MKMGIQVSLRTQMSIWTSLCLQWDSSPAWGPQAINPRTKVSRICCWVSSWAPLGSSLQHLAGAEKLGEWCG